MADIKDEDVTELLALLERIAAALEKIAKAAEFAADQF